MKTNLPVTGQEKHLPAGASLVSRTDTKGIITFVNDAFVEASGFSREELIGSNHNIVRHPDVPASIFEGIWRTLKCGLPWHGPVKNRCKNGDYYWVLAQVVPVRKNGETIGYMSLRSALDPARVPEAEAAYQRAASVEVFGEAGNGLLKQLLSVKNGVMFGILFVTLLMIAGGILGITGLKMSSKAMHALYYEEMSPVQSIGRINFLMADNRAQVALALHHNPAAHSWEEFDHTVSEHLEHIARNKKEIDELWAAYSVMPRGSTEKKLADDYAQARAHYVNEGLVLAKQALEQGNYLDAESLLLKNVSPLYREANAHVTVLLKFLSEKAENNFREVEERNQAISAIAISGLSVGIAIVIFSGFFFFRGTVSPLNNAVSALERITEGNLSGKFRTTGFGEPGRVMTAVTIMQIHLKTMMDEIRQSASSIHQQCQRLNQTMMNLAQHSEEQHDRVYQALDTISVAESQLTKLARDAELIADCVESGATQGELIDSAARVPAEILSDETCDSMFADLGLTAISDDAVDVTHAAPGEALADRAPSSPPSSVQNSIAAGTENPQLALMARDLASATRIEVFSVEEGTAQIQQVASLIVENRAEVQDAWAASQKLEQTARELDQLVKFFD